MCGIIGYTGSSFLASKVVLDGLEKLEYRGYDSAGVAIIENGKITVKRDSGKLRHIRESLEKNLPTNQLAIGHTRWATHGRPTQNNAHPHKDNNSRIVLVHNGIIENFLQLRSDLKEKGHNFLSETDTEIIVHLLAENEKNEDNFKDAFFKTLSQLEGAWALSVIHVDYPDTVFIAKKNCPLLVGLTEDEGNFVSSDITAIIKYTRDVVYLEDFQAGMLTPNNLTIFDTKTKSQVNYKVEKVDWNPVMAEKGGYRHFMLKEIHEQPDVIRNTIGSNTDEESGKIFLPNINMSDDDLKNIKKIIVVACGTAFYAGLVGRYLIEKLARVTVEMDLASEFRYRDPVLDKDTLVVAVTQSGETADTLAAIVLAKEKGCKTMAIVNVQGSSIARTVDGNIFIHAGPEIGVASTKAYMAMLVAFELFAIYMANLREKIEVSFAKELIHELKILPQKIEEVLAKKESILKISQKYTKYTSMLFLGRDLNFPTALEGALKLKEISYIHAEGYAAGEMKHGPIALIDSECPVVAIVTASPTYEKVVSNVVEARSRDCRVLSIASEGDKNVYGFSDDVIKVPKVMDLLSPLLNVLPLQLFAYYVADLKGADVDQPRNLAKSVTVE
ncbi:MAG: glutamine--fructose-6-phosphate transaminase (isomerizing) [Candidatus Cloacimonadota bacterium]|nr:MAG: glutamine--fructose-6-phosphate transaminase (isomerizing) [Candidatus Cloacimonadota bacterium]